MTSGDQGTDAVEAQVDVFMHKVVDYQQHLYSHGCADTGGDCDQTDPFYNAIESSVRKLVEHAREQEQAIRRYRAWGVQWLASAGWPHEYGRGATHKNTVPRLLAPRLVPSPREASMSHYVGDDCKPDGHRLLNPYTRNVLATVALSHEQGCDCEAACKPLRIDREYREERPA